MNRHRPCDFLRPGALLAAAVLAAALILCPPASAGKAQPVQTLDKADLDRLIAAEKGPALLTAMAAWCAPCRDELPDLVRLYAKYRACGVRFAGLALDLEGPQAMAPLAERYGINFPMYWIGEPAFTDYEIFSVPMLLVIRDGRIAERVPGRMEAADLEAAFRAACSTPPRAP